MSQPPLVEPLRRWDPEQIGGFVLLGRLGAGAMGQVYLGRSPAGRLVAVKTIKTELAEEPDFRTRFGQEVAAARRVSGAFTAAVVAADSEADVPWLATVYVPAPSLSTLVRSCGPLPVAAVRWLAAGCAEALESIHGVGLVHRDLKPANVLVCLDGPRVIDFGVARAAERIALTVTRGSVGTPAYMAPEQARDTRQATFASDMFSLGATMLFAATGHAPYDGETVMDVLVRLATQPPDLAGLPDELADIVVPCLDREPRSRPSSATIVARLAHGLADEGGEFGAAPLPEPAVALIEEYRRLPRAPVHDGGQTDPGRDGSVLTGGVTSAEDTFGSRPTGHSNGVRGGAEPVPGTAASGSAGHARPPRRRFGSAGTARRLAFVSVGVLAASVALVAAGWAIGSHSGHGHAPSNAANQKTVSDRGSPSPSPTESYGAPGAGGTPGTGGSTGTGASTGKYGLPARTRSNPLGLGPQIGPPPQGPPPTPDSGPPGVGVSQLTGDSNTVFVIGGQNWPIGQRLTITLVGVGTSPIQPVVDNEGMFNYAINQDHEFFSGGLPLGVYTVRVTDAAGGIAEARFEVNAK